MHENRSRMHCAKRAAFVLYLLATVSLFVVPQAEAKRALHAKGNEKASVRHYDTGLSIGAENLATVDNVRQVFWKEIRPGKVHGKVSDTVMQAIGVNGDSLFITQNVKKKGGSWSSSSVVRISQYPLAKADSEHWDVTRTGGDTPVAMADLRGLGHGTGCAVIREHGATYIYSSVSSPHGQEPVQGVNCNIGTGFSKIRWRGSATTQQDVTFYRNLNGVYSAELTVTPDGKYLIFHGYEYTAAPDSETGFTRVPCISVFDRKELEAAAQPHLVRPVHRFVTPAEVGNSLGLVSGACSGVVSDGQHIFALYSSPHNAGLRSIVIYTFDGKLIKALPVSGMASLATREFLHGKDGKVCHAFEIEGLALYNNVLLMATKLNFSTPGDIVRWDGKNYICTVSGSGVEPSSKKHWARTEVPATSGEYSSSKHYKAYSDPVYHKYITGIVPQGLYNFEHALADGLYKEH